MFMTFLAFLWVLKITFSFNYLNEQVHKMVKMSKGAV